MGASGVADGAWIKATFKFYSDWALFQTSDPTGANFISAEYQAGPLLPGQSPASVQSLAVRFDQKGHERPYQKAVIVDVVDGYLNAGDHIIIRLGTAAGAGRARGCRPLWKTPSTCGSMWTRWARRALWRCRRTW